MTDRHPSEIDHQKQTKAIDISCANIWNESIGCFDRRQSRRVHPSAAVERYLYTLTFIDRQRHRIVKLQPRRYFFSIFIVILVGTIPHLFLTRKGFWSALRTEICAELKAMSPELNCVEPPMCAVLAETPKISCYWALELYPNLLSNT